MSENRGEFRSLLKKLSKKVGAIDERVSADRLMALSAEVCPCDLGQLTTFRNYKTNKHVFR